LPFTVIFQSRVNVKDESWNVSPAVTVADEDKPPANKQLPAVKESHNEKCEYVSVAATFVHSTIADDDIEPPAAAENEILLRVVSVAAFDVPVSPGSPVCNFT
jgi:hypothetical protein